MKTLSWKLIATLGMVIILVATTMHLALESPQSAPPQVTPLKAKAAKLPRDFSLLAERIQTLAYRQPTAEELEEEQQYDREQALAATNDLHDPDPAKRSEAAEQLGAYPGAEAEELLTQALAQDGDAGVRKLAAQTLDTLDKPSNRAIDTLLQAIEDDTPEVQQASLLTLERWLNEGVNDDRNTRIVRGLKNVKDSRGLAKETRDYLQELLEQAGPG